MLLQLNQIDCYNIDMGDLKYVARIIYDRNYESNVYIDIINNIIVFENNTDGHYYGHDINIDVETSIKSYIRCGANDTINIVSALSIGRYTKVKRKFKFNNIRRLLWKDVHKLFTVHLIINVCTLVQNPIFDIEKCDRGEDYIEPEMIIVINN